MKKIIIFDLDGTLWSVNSHIDIIRQYYKHNYLKQFIYKVFGKCFPNIYLHCINHLFEKIPDAYVNKYCPVFRYDALKLLDIAKIEGYEIIIISLAPQRILDNVAKRLKLPVLKGMPGRKSEVLRRYYKNWERLVVVTDNISDCDMVKMSDKAIIYTMPKYIKKFKNKCRGIDMEFRDRRLK